MFSKTINLLMIMFDTFKVKKPKRSTFPLSHTHRTTVNIGDINLMHWNWCYPGDRFKIRYSFLAKFAAMIAPNYSRMRIKSECFYVPLSDLYDNFHDFIMNYKESSETVIENGTQKTVTNIKLPFVPLNRFAWFLNKEPQLGNAQTAFFDRMAEVTVFGQYAVDRFIHQLGVPFDVCRKYLYNGTTTFTTNPYCANERYLDTETVYNINGQVPISILPAQAYQYVYNWYYRDSTRSPEIDCYPDIKQNNFLGNIFCDNEDLSTYVDSGVAPTQRANFTRFVNSLFQVRRRFYRKDYFNTAISDPTVGVDSVAVPDNIVDLRKANALQKFIEKHALAGNRVAEFIMSHWGHKIDNYELGRPILISSSSQNVQVSEVLQTSQTTTGDDASPQGSRSGVANSYGNSRGAYFVSPDYGILLINMSIVPEISYFSGVPRKLTPTRWEHFAWPEFAQVGMQPIYKFELSRGVTDGDDGSPTPLSIEQMDVFGYAPRYSEYKMELDQISGEMATSLRFWHQSPALAPNQKLNENFGVVGFVDYNNVQAVTPTAFNVFWNFYYNQIFAVQNDLNTDHCEIFANFDITVNRALPANDMPAL